MSNRTVLILGGGVGGLVAARRLRRALPGGDRIVLIDREHHHLFQPSLLWLAAGTRTPERIRRPLANLAGPGIEVVQAEVESIDPAARRVRAGGRELEGDAIIVSLGAVLAPERIPGMEAAGHNLYTVEGAEALRNAHTRLTGGRLVLLTAAPAYKCPAAPYEAAMLLADRSRRLGVRSTTEIDMYAAEPGPMGVAGPDVSAAVRRMVESEGIRYHPGHQITRVDPDRKLLTFANGVEAPYDLLAYVPPHRAPDVVAGAGMVSEAGWVPVDRRTFATKFPGVYAIGDVTIVPLTMGKPLPKAGVFAHRQAEVVAGIWRGNGPAGVNRGRSTATGSASSRPAGVAPGSAAAISTVSRCRRSGCTHRSVVALGKDLVRTGLVAGADLTT